jgi:hypothetical protein
MYKEKNNLLLTMADFNRKQRTFQEAFHHLELKCSAQNIQEKKVEGLRKSFDCEDFLLYRKSYFFGVLLFAFSYLLH